MAKKKTVKKSERKPVSKAEERRIKRLKEQWKKDGVKVDGAPKISRKKMGKVKKVPDRIPDMLERSTGISKVRWCKWIEKRIKKHTIPLEGEWKGHGETNVKAWIDDLFFQVAAQIQERNPSGAYDGNIMMSKVMGMLLITWAVRVSRAKAYDPRRPKRIRQHAMEALTMYQRELFMNMIDERFDPDIFDQEYDAPWSKYARDGEFI